MSDNQPSVTPSPNANTGVLSTTSKINLVILCVLFFIFTIVLLTEYLENIVCMFATALVLTYILLGPVTWLERGVMKIRVGAYTPSRNLARVLAIVLVYLMGFGLLVISVFRVAPPLATQITEFTRELPSHLSQITERQNQGTAKQAPLSELVQESLQESSRQKVAGGVDITTQTHVTVTAPKRKTPLLKATYSLALEKLLANYNLYASRLGSLLLDIGSATLNIVIYGLTTLVLVFYLLHDGKLLHKGLVSLIPDQYESRVDRFLIRLHLQFHTIVKGQLLMSLLSGGLMYALLLLIGTKFALLLSVFFGVTSILPVIGPWIGLIPIVGLLAFSQHPVDILQVLFASGLFYLIKTYWLWPKLIRRKYDIHPILFTLSFVACLKIAGLLGFLLSFPLATILGVVAASVKERHAAVTAHHI